MKKLIVGLALAGCSLPLLAEQSIHLEAGKALEVTSVAEVVLHAGDSKDNVWFSVDPGQVSQSSEKQLSNCVLTASLSLNEGELNFASHNLRCPSLTGDVYTAENIQVKLTTPVSQICSSAGNQCTQVTLSTSQFYSLTLEDSAELVPAYNASREVNRMRVEEQYQD